MTEQTAEDAFFAISVTWIQRKELAESSGQEEFIADHGQNS